MEPKIPPPLVAKIFETAASHPNKEALICGETRVTYAELKTKIASAAAYLKEMGVVAGDRVVLSASSSRPSFVYGYFACHALGAVAVPVDPKIGENTLQDILAQTEPRAAFLSGPDLDRLDGGSTVQLSLAAAGLDNTADILYTGGTTGRPKGVMQTHRNILAFALSRNAVVLPGPEDRLVIPLPLSHGFGLGRLRCAMLGGGTVILIDGFVEPDKIFAAFKRHQATGFCCVPSGFAALFQLTGDKLGGYRDQLNYIETATAPLPAEQRARLLRLLPKTRLFNSYGMTETTSTIAFVELGAAPAELGSVGKLIPGVRVRAVDAHGQDAPAGEPGQLLFRGENVMKGYWKDPAATREALIEGWYKSNDVGLCDAAGYLYLKGRKEELINVGGLKVAPIEIENALKEHPAVKECACVGVSDPAGLTGETVKAFLVLAPGRTAMPAQDELVGLLRGKLEPYKIPSQFVWVDELPKTGLGKIQRSRLKDDEAALVRLLETVKRSAR
jgi:long-chain acyl-CoA synthetase